MFSFWEKKDRSDKYLEAGRRLLVSLVAAMANDVLKLRRIVPTKQNSQQKKNWGMYIQSLLTEVFAFREFKDE